MIFRDTQSMACMHENQNEYLIQRHEIISQDTRRYSVEFDCPNNFSPEFKRPSIQAIWVEQNSEAS